MTAQGTRESAERAFIAATRALADAVEQDDPHGLPEHIARQDACFRALVDADGGHPSPALAEEAERTLDLARERLVSVRKELERVRDARRVVSSMRDNEPAARFISRRV